MASASEEGSFTMWGSGILHNTKKFVEDMLEKIKFATPEEERAAKEAAAARAAGNRHRRKNSFMAKDTLTKSSIPRYSNTASTLDITPTMLHHILGEDNTVYEPFGNRGTVQNARADTERYRSKGALSSVRTPRVGDADSLPLALAVDTETKELEYGEEHEIFVALSVLGPSESNLLEPWVRCKVSLVFVIQWAMASKEGMEAIISTMRLVSRQFGPVDSVTIITAGDTSTFAMTGKGKAEYEEALDAMGQLESTGGSLWELLQEGVTTAKKLASKAKDGVVHTMILSNDDSPPASAEGDQRAIMEALDELPPNCRVSTFGYEQTHDIQSLCTIARKGRGMYHYLADPNTIRWCLGDAIGSTIATLGYSVHLTCTAVCGANITSLQTDFPRLSDEAGKCELSIGHVSLEESKCILLSLNIPKRDAAVPEETVLEVSLVYTDAKSNTVFKVDDSVSFARPLAKSDSMMFVYRGIAIEKERVRGIAVECMNAARQAADKGDFDNANEKMVEMKESLLKSRAAHDPVVLTLRVDAETLSDAIEAPEVYNEWGRRRFNHLIDRHTMQCPAGCVGDAFGCPWRDYGGFTKLYDQCPVDPSTFRSVASSWGYKTL